MYWGWSVPELLLLLITSGWTRLELQRKFQHKSRLVVRQNKSSTIDFPGQAIYHSFQACNCTIFQEWLCTLISTHRAFIIDTTWMSFNTRHVHELHKDLGTVVHLAFAVCLVSQFSVGQPGSSSCGIFMKCMRYWGEKMLNAYQFYFISPLGSFQVAWGLLSTNCKTEELMNHSSYLVWHASPLDYSLGEPKAFNNSTKL